MVKATRSSFGETTLHGWISIIWLSSAVGIAGCQGLELKTSPNVVATCGDNVTLTCAAISSQKLDVKLFAWLGNNKTLCSQHDGQLDPDVLCEATPTPPHELRVTLINVKPVHKGNYLCKLQSNLGAKSAKTLLSVQDCLESELSFIDSSHAECNFTGVYPRGTVHWFQGDNNLTHLARTREEEDQCGRYDVRSEIKLEEGESREDINCSLWVPDDGKYLSSLNLTKAVVEKSTGSSSCRVQLQWICIMVEIVVFKSMA
ncbi:hypothetical protein Q5P01_017564 [Channa striata]|uniref:Ig-like domain-containing protein n=1 Tax=Channa striata TaxID=64152 RepID=A0AA88SD38_CHASR|nr:hypothetical protein Q5P01_017564 [Channa striata]